MTKGKIAVILIILAAAGFGIWWMIKKKRDENTDSPDNGTYTQPGGVKPGTPTKTQPVAKPATPENTNKPYKYGDKGKDILFMQQRLNQKFKSGIKEDGIWGAETAGALQKNGFNPGSLFYADYLKVIK